MKTTQHNPFYNNAKCRYLIGNKTLRMIILLLILLLPPGILPVSASAQLQENRIDADTLAATLAECPASISFGETIHCSITTEGEIDAYTFTASAGDRVLVRLSKTELGNLWPGVIVNGTGGAELCEQNSLDSTTAEIAGCSLPDTGTYTILAHDGLYGSFTGEYHLYLQRLNNPGSPVFIAFGQTLPASIITSAEMDTYTFSASAGDKVLVRMSKDLLANFWPGIRVYGPDGTKLCELNSSNSTTAEIASCSLPGTGTYTILAYESSYGMYADDYHLYLQRLNNPGDPISISFDLTLSGSIITTAEMDTFTFAASMGDRVLVRMIKTSGNLWPGVRIYGPDGTKLCEMHSPNSVIAEISSCSLPGAGTYTILAFDDLYGMYTGNYQIYLVLLKYPRAYLPLIIK